MEIGKISTKLLKNIIIEPAKNIAEKKEILIKPEIGEDCAAIDFENEICVLSSDPITGTSENIGKLAVNINANDIASSGAEPIGILITVLLPPSCTENDFEKIINSIYDNANKAGISVLGGHTEVTDAVTRPVISCTAVGKTKNRVFISSGGAKIGDDVLMTKYAGLEGTSIIANDFENELAGNIDSDLIENAKGLKNQLSVIKEGKIAAEFGVLCMHDVTEGGIFGACYEIAFCSDAGIEIYEDKIPVLDETKAICDFFNLNPYRLISSGCMLISCKDGARLADIFEKNGIKASIIGKITEKDKYIIKNNEKKVLNEPESDELYKVKAPQDFD